MGSDAVVSPPVCGPRGVPARGVVPERWTASGSAVDARCDTPARLRRAACAADSGGMGMPRALSGAPRVPCMHAQRVARLHPLVDPQLLATTAMTSRHTVGVVSPKFERSHTLLRGRVVSATRA